MRILLALLLIVCSATVFAQADDKSEQLKILKELYDRKKISLEQYQEMSNKLLRDNQTIAQQQAIETPQLEPAFIDTASYQRTEEYCLLVASFKLFSVKAVIDVYFGQKFSGIGWSKNKSGRLNDFDNPVDALNFMNSKGWELMTSTSVANQMHCFLKRRITFK
ncbi:MAG TPA: SHOCT domain-containing protein [Chitinophagales bacterium]|nr:SHOCT domain-containing protein [Chitinophagales bacterium]